MNYRAELPAYEADAQTLRTTISYFPSGVVALLAEVGGEVKGMVASAFTVGVSVDPPLVSCAIQRSSGTWPLLKQADRIGISVLAEGQGALARQISSRNREARFTDVPIRDTGSSARFIAGAPVWFECVLFGEHSAGDHTIALLEITALGADPTLRPLVFHGSTFGGLQMPGAELATA